MINVPKDMLPDVIHETASFGPLTVINYKNAKCVIVKFINTGFKKTVQANAIRIGRLKDPYHPNVQGVGFIGSGMHRSKKNGKHTLAYKSWSRMMERGYCHKYKSKNHTYIGVTVCKEWHNFQNFAEWFELNFIEGFHLDKDIKIKGNKVYRPEACMFVSCSDNTIEAHAKHYTFIDPKGNITKIYNLLKFCRDNNLNKGNMANVACGLRKSCSGWSLAK